MTNTTPTNEYIYGKTPNDFLKDNFQALPTGKILLLAEGEGRNAVFLAQQGYDVTGVDLSSVGLAKAQQLAAANNVAITTVQADLAEFDLGKNAWDGIVSIFCHLPPPLRADLHQRIEKALKPNGALLLESYRPEQLTHKTGGPSVAELMVSQADLRAELPNLTFDYLQDVEREVIEGTDHFGLAAVVQAIAVK